MIAGLFVGLLLEAAIKIVFCFIYVAAYVFFGIFAVLVNILEQLIKYGRKIFKGHHASAKFAITVLLTLLLSFPVFDEIFYCKCIGVVDGDTIEVKSMDHRTRIRIFGIDCPEKKQGFNTQAKKFTSGLVFGKIVKIERLTKDIWGRTVGKVFVNGKDVGYELLRAGMAWHFKRYSSDMKYAQAELSAKSKKIGIWSIRKSSPPWQYRRKSKTNKNANVSF